MDNNKITEEYSILTGLRAKIRDNKNLHQKCPLETAGILYELQKAISLIVKELQEESQKEQNNE